MAASHVLAEPFPLRRVPAVEALTEVSRLEDERSGLSGPTAAERAQSKRHAVHSSRSRGSSRRAKGEAPPKKNGNSTDCGDPSCLSNPIARLRGRHLVYRRDEIFTELKVILVSRLPPTAKDDFDSFQ
jgi:hypothetical protein